MSQGWHSRKEAYDVKAAWEAEEAKTRSERRKRYKCGNKFVTMKDILPWAVYAKQHQLPIITCPPIENTPSNILPSPMVTDTPDSVNSNTITPNTTTPATTIDPSTIVPTSTISPPSDPVVPPSDPSDGPQTPVAETKTPTSPNSMPQCTPSSGIEGASEGIIKVPLSPGGQLPSDSGVKDVKNEKKLTKSTPVYKNKSSPPAEPLTSEKFQLYRKINRKLSTWHGDITQLEIDGVVNAANNSLLGGGGIDGAIHSAAGENLRRECAQLNGCKTGLTKTTRAYKLPAKYVLHTVGPIGENEEKLQSCYQTVLEECVKYQIRTVAICGISTGIFGYPLLPASHIACRTVKTWMENPDNLEKIDRVIFCTFLEREKDCYQQLLLHYFPPVEDEEFIQSYLSTKDTPEEEEDIKIKDVSPEKGEVKGIFEKGPPAEKEKEVNIPVTQEKDKENKETLEKEVTDMKVDSPKEGIDKEGNEKTSEKMEEKEPNKNG